MANGYRKIHWIIRAALFVVLWMWVLPLGVNKLWSLIPFDSLGIPSDLPNLLYRLVYAFVQTLALRYLVFFTRAGFGQTTWPMFLGLAFCELVDFSLQYAMQRWGLADVVLIMPTGSTLVAALVTVGCLAANVLVWIVLARNVRSKSGYVGAVVLQAFATLLFTRYSAESESVLMREMGVDFTMLISYAFGIGSMLSAMLSMWHILYKGQLDTIFRGAAAYDGGAAGHAGSVTAPRQTDRAAARTTGTATRPASPAPRPASDSPDFGAYTSLTEADMDRYWQEDASAHATTASQAQTVAETDLTRDYIAFLSEWGCTMSRAAELLRTAPSHFE